MLILQKLLSTGRRKFKELSRKLSAINIKLNNCTCHVSKTNFQYLVQIYMSRYDRFITKRYDAKLRISDYSDILK